MTLIQKTDEWGRPDYTEPWDWNVPEIPTFPETESGRRRKGELEALVDYVVKEWLVVDTDMEYFDVNNNQDCTAEYIAHRCTELDGRPTSSGAVWNILTMWVEMKYAETSTHPNRFLTLTSEGMAKGLKQIHEETKRRKKKEKRDAEVRQFNNAQITSKVRKMR